MVNAMDIQVKKRRRVNAQPRPFLFERLMKRRDEEIRLLSIKIKRLKFNDELVCGRLRLVWIQPTSRCYFVLYAGEKKIGKVEVRADYPSDAKIQQLAAILVLAGFKVRNTQTVQAAVLGFPRKLSRVPNLFTLSDG